MPPHIRDALHHQADLRNLIEAVLDLGRPPEARFPNRAINMSDSPITREDLDYVTHRVGAFTQDNRAGIERTPRPFLIADIRCSVRSMPARLSWVNAPTR